MRASGCARHPPPYFAQSPLSKGVRFVPPDSVVESVRPAPGFELPAPKVLGLQFPVTSYEWRVSSAPPPYFAESPLSKGVRFVPPDSVVELVRPAPGFELPAPKVLGLQFPVTSYEWRVSSAPPPYFAESPLSKGVRFVPRDSVVELVRPAPGFELPAPEVLGLQFPVASCELRVASAPPPYFA